MIIEGKLVHIPTIDPESDDDDEVDDHFLDACSRGKSLAEFRFRVEEAIKGNYLFTTNDDDEDDRAHLWGVALLHEEAADAAVLSKFLKAKRYKVHEAFTALHRTLRWRADFRPADEELAPPRDNAWFASGADKEGRPLCYSVLGREYQRNLVSMGQQSCNEYLRWRLLCLEKGIRRLTFRPGGADSIVQIVDMRHAGGPTTKEMKLIGKKMIALLHDHYPGIIHKHVSSYRVSLK